MPKRILFFIGVILLFQIHSFAQTNFRSHKLIDEGWTFHFGHAENPKKDFNFGIATIFAKSGAASGTAIDPRYNDSSWRKLNLPHDWAVELPFVKSPSFDVMSHGYKPVGGLFPETSIGWYRKHLRIPASDSGRRFQLQFDGVFRNAQFWFNGFYLGRNESGYVGADFDITDYINYDRDNVLVVRVDATQYEGWFYEGAGIYRHVWLNSFNNLHIDPLDAFVHSDVTDNTASVTIEASAVNQYFHDTAALFQAYITDRNGTVLSRTSEVPFQLTPNGSAPFNQTIVVNNPRLWTIEDPYLYHAFFFVKTRNAVVDSLHIRFGIRTVQMTGVEGFLLNGKHIKIKGTNNHQDHAGLGTALPDELHYYRVHLLKQMGSNAYRTSHNMPAKELLEACDSLGMLVLPEQRLLNSSAEYVAQFTRLVKSARNHPSVFLWSIGNEEGWIQRTTTGKRIAQTLLAKQRELDPTRTSTYAADVANVFRGVNEVIPVRGFNYRDSAVGDYHQDHPDQPIVGTEMGSTVTTRGIYKLDTINAYVPDQDITSPWWASTAEEWWKPAAENNYWMGGFIWTGFDYRGEPTPFEWPNINSHFGVMDMCGFPKNIYYYYQSWWKDSDVLHISPHWNRKGNEGQPIDVWVNSNADKVELFLNRKSLGVKTMVRNSHLKWQVPYRAGKLEAVGYWGKRKKKEVVETTGEPYSIILSPHKTSLTANGLDVCVVNVSLVDKQGREVPTGNNEISFSVDSEAQIIGVGNGDPSSHEPDKFVDGGWKRKAFSGKCQVIIQAGKKKGTIKLTARSEGLPNASLTLNVE